MPLSRPSSSWQGTSTVRIWRTDLINHVWKCITSSCVFFKSRDLDSLDLDQYILYNRQKKGVVIRMVDPNICMNTSRIQQNLCLHFLPYHRRNICGIMSYFLQYFYKSIFCLHVLLQQSPSSSVAWPIKGQLLLASQSKFTIWRRARVYLFCKQRPRADNDFIY